MSEAPRKVCVVGGGASGVALLWCLTENERTRGEVELTLLHSETKLGGHSHTLYPEFDGTAYPVDVGVQYICPLLYPNTHTMLSRPEFAKVGLTPGQVTLSMAFGPEMNWGNIPEYQSGERFAKLFTEENQAAARKFQNDVLMSLVNGTFNQQIGDYLKTADLPSDFVNYFLMPYLSILNGYGNDEQLLLAEFEDLWPLFTDLMTPGPLAAFLSPGEGWQRFTDGSSSWVEAMSNYATGHGATVLLGTEVTAVWPDEDGQHAWVEWSTPEAPLAMVQQFDAVVLTTDMETNDQLLNNPKNPNYAQQHRYIGPEVFDLNPGSCFIHQDDSVLAPWLRDQVEIAQFNGTTPPGPGERLPYDMGASYLTYILQAMVEGMPEPVYVTMYGVDEPPNPPAPEKMLAHPIRWRHGRFLGSMFMNAKRGVHNVQGLGNVWFAGNNTTQDSEEGALISAMVIAEKLRPEWEYPFRRIDAEDAYAFGWYELMKDEFMFPKAAGAKKSLCDRLATDLLERTTKDMLERWTEHRESN